MLAMKLVLVLAMILKAAATNYAGASRFRCQGSIVSE